MNNRSKKKYTKLAGVRRAVTEKVRVGVSVADMPDVVDLMDKAFAKNQMDSNKIVNDTFIFGIFNNIAKKVNLVEEYIEYMF